MKSKIQTQHSNNNQFMTIDQSLQSSTVLDAEALKKKQKEDEMFSMLDELVS